MTESLNNKFPPESKNIYIWKNIVVNNMMVVSETFNTDLMTPEDIKWDRA